MSEKMLSQVLAEQSRSWQAGARLLVEQLLQQVPALASDEQAVLDLIYHEKVLRERAGERPGQEEYLRRFPNHAHQLQLLFALDAALEDEPATASTPAAPSPTDSEPAERSGQWWPHVPGYELLEELGRGGMGAVYKARQVSLQRLVALKVIRADRLGHAQAVRRFQREALAAARLRHPNIVLIHEANRVGLLHYLAMEYVDGIDLHRLVKQAGRLSFEQARDFLCQAARGLQHAHEMGLVHRDVKPANLMVSGLSGATPTLKILDMGLALLGRHGASDEPISSLTHTGAFLGTPDFVAPEQIEAAHRADIRSDLYSLGCTLYFWLTGQVPFPGATMMEKLDGHRFGTPTPVEELRSGVPADLLAVMGRLMARKPEERFATPAEVVAALTKPATATVPPGEVRCWQGHQGSVWGLAIHQQSLALSGGDDGTVRLWDVRELRCLEGHTRSIWSVCFSPDGGYAFSSSLDGTVRLWDLAQGREVRRFPPVRWLATLVFPAEARRLLLGGMAPELLWFSAETGACERQRLEGPVDNIHDLRPSADGKRIVSVDDDQTLRLWDVETGRELPAWGGTRLRAAALAISSDAERVLVTTAEEEAFQLVETRSGQELRRFEGHRGRVRSLAWIGDGRQALSGGDDGTVRLWDTATGREVACFTGHSGGVVQVAPSENGRLALSGGADGTVRLWKLAE